MAPVLSMINSAGLVVMTAATGSKKVMKIKKRKARCKKVLAILCNEIKALELLREEVYPPVGDFADGPTEYAICRLKGAGSFDEVIIPLCSVIFLQNQ